MGKTIPKRQFLLRCRNWNLYLPFGRNFISKKNIRIQKQTKNNLLDKRMQKLHHERNLLQEKELQNNPRLWKPFQNQNATENGNRLGTKNLQKTIKNSRTTICTHKTKYETPWIHNNRNKKHKHRIQTIYNRTQPKKNIQWNKHKKQLK